LQIQGCLCFASGNKETNGWVGLKGKGMGFEPGMGWEMFSELWIFAFESKIKFK
jgi:hypothetical protein